MKKSFLILTLLLSTLAAQAQVYLTDVLEPIGDYLSVRSGVVKSDAKPMRFSMWYELPYSYLDIHSRGTSYIPN